MAVRKLGLCVSIGLVCLSARAATVGGSVFLAPPDVICPPDQSPCDHYGVDVLAGIHPDSIFLSGFVNAQIMSGSVRFDPVNASMLPPVYTPNSTNTELHSSMFSIPSDFPNNLTFNDPVEAMPPQGSFTANSGLISVNWSDPTGTPDADGSFIMLRLTLAQAPGMAPLTLSPTNEHVATISVSGQFVEEGLPTSAQGTIDVYRVPEPASLLSLVLGAMVLRRRVR